MEIFHYRKLLNKLIENFEVDRVHIFKYEDIIVNKLKKLQDLMLNNYRRIVGCNLSHHNQRIQKNEYFVTSKYEVSLVDNIYQYFDWVRRNNSKPIVLVKKIAKPTVKIIDKITRMKLKVQRPSENDIVLLKKSLVSETAALEERFGIKYNL